jgi:hypothetical protein
MSVFLRHCENSPKIFGHNVMMTEKNDRHRGYFPNLAQRSHERSEKQSNLLINWPLQIASPTKNKVGSQ